MIMGNRENWLKSRPDGHNISAEVKDALDALKSELCDIKFGEPFWEDEFRAEPGFAFENQVRSQSDALSRSPATDKNPHPVALGRRCYPAGQGEGGALHKLCVECEHAPCLAHLPSHAALSG